MDKRERMAREKRAKAKAGRVERLTRRRTALEKARSEELDRRRKTNEARVQLLEALRTASFPDDPVKDDSVVTSQGESSTS
jgi:hypothetical protein